MSGGVVVGQKCETCYGEGRLPTDEGVVPCPDCGGAGRLPHPDTLVEWRLREIERLHGARGGEVAKDIEWLAFELRRAREALTDVLTLTDEIAESEARTRMRFVASRTLGLYELSVVSDPDRPK
jgi:hypothetical protein